MSFARGIRTVGGAGVARSLVPRPVVSGMVAAVQALVLSLLIVELPAIAAFLAAASNGDDGEGAGWGSSTMVGARLWLLAHGVPAELDGATITLIPLGLTAVAVASCYASARRSAQATASAVIAGSATYAAVTVGLAAATGAGIWGLLAAVLGGALLSGIGLAGGMAARSGGRWLADAAWPGRRTVAALPRIGVVGAGAVGAVAGVAVLAGASAVLVAAWVVTGRSTQTDILTALAPGTVGAIILALAQLALLPNLVVWAGAWIVGSGFRVGADSRFTASSAETGRLPAVPLLGALPGDPWVGGAARWAPLIAVLAGVAAGALARRRLDRLPRPGAGAGRGGPANAGNGGPANAGPANAGPANAGPAWGELAIVAISLAATAAVVVGVVASMGSGAIGSDRLNDVGAGWLSTGLLAGVEIGGGAAAYLAVRKLLDAARRRRGGAKFE